ncbi:uncharacterized protein DS421_12g365320 [Arachis hypogaea]|nr:uncharacterized protein DS421_12g365320 [Arachis hypogaea]
MCRRKRHRRAQGHHWFLKKEMPPSLRWTHSLFLHSLFFVFYVKCLSMFVSSLHDH